MQEPWQDCRTIHRQGQKAVRPLRIKKESMNRHAALALLRWYLIIPQVWDDARQQN
jgi:hypothetical protein